MSKSLGILRRRQASQLRSRAKPGRQTIVARLLYDAERWNPSIRLVLKKIGMPTPMYAQHVDSQPPVNNKPVGYDLAVGDWIAPHGKGQTSDIIFLRQFSKRSRFDYDSTLTVSFPNAGDGIQQFAVEPDEGVSDLCSPRQAPSGGYMAKVERVNISHPPETVKWDYDPNRKYFFRVRTVLDEKGNVKSALYGKIYGDFMHFTYYLNPTPNDRNIEFDPKQNLLPNQHVTAP
jgi:hypothetical protein